MQATEMIFEEIERIRWHTSAGLSVFKNLDLPTGHERAEVHLKAIEKALRAIDCAKDLPLAHDIFRTEESIGRKTVRGD